MSTILSDLTIEKIPVSGVYESSNTLITVAGLAVMRVSDFRATIDNTLARYAEVGSKDQTIYQTQKRINGTLNRAYVNGAEWRLAIGLPADKQRVGVLADFGATDESADEQSLTDLLATKKVSTEVSKSVRYPMKVNIIAELNKDSIENMDYNRAVQSKKYQLFLSILNAMIDRTQITFNNRGLVTSGATPFEAEFATIVVKEITT